MTFRVSLPFMHVMVILDGIGVGFSDVVATGVGDADGDAPLFSPGTTVY